MNLNDRPWARANVHKTLKLQDMVDVAIDNEVCIVFAVKENMRMALISTGCFYGDEELIRISRTPDQTMTIFRKDGRRFNWTGSTRVTDEVKRCAKMIRECVEDFGLSTTPERRKG